MWGRNKAKFGNEDSNQGGDTLKNSMEQNDENFVWFKKDWFNEDIKNKDENTNNLNEDIKNKDENTNNLNDDFREISLDGSSQKLISDDKIASLIKKIRNCEEPPREIFLKSSLRLFVYSS